MCVIDQVIDADSIQNTRAVWITSQMHWYLIIYHYEYYYYVTADQFNNLAINISSEPENIYKKILRIF